MTDVLESVQSPPFFTATPFTFRYVFVSPFGDVPSKTTGASAVPAFNHSVPV